MNLKYESIILRKGRQTTGDNGCKRKLNSGLPESWDTRACLLWLPVASSLTGSHTSAPEPAAHSSRPSSSAQWTGIAATDRGSQNNSWAFEQSWTAHLLAQCCILILHEVQLPGITLTILYYGTVWSKLTAITLGYPKILTRIINNMMSGIWHWYNRTTKLLLVTIQVTSFFCGRYAITHHRIYY